jgi:predicted ATPase/transcriptional regulator with XRE-family HTH domain
VAHAHWGACGDTCRTFSGSGCAGEASSLNTSITTPFGELLRWHRLAAALSQEALAQRAGLSIDAIRALERGRRTAPHPGTVVVLADALDLPASVRAAFIAAAAETPASSPERVVPPAVAPPSMLPSSPTVLIGREREEASVAHLLKKTRGRLVTLTGPGGVGKTRLALQVTATLRREFADGVTFVDLSPVRDAALLPDAITRALGVRTFDSQSAQAALLAYLRERACLLVLDNFEQIVDAAPFVATLLEQCPRLSILATSRIPLQLRAEQQFPVSPLAIPAPEEHTIAAEAAGYAAVQLFVEGARAAQPSFVLTEENAAVVAAICQRLDGLPLAIELAAARIGLLPPSALLARLGQIAMRMQGTQDLPNRQRTLRDTIDWSYNLLPTPEQQLFTRLGIFAGGCTLEAAETICDTGEIEIVDGIGSLLNNNLLRTAPGEPGEPRFTMLETIREYARDRLASAGEFGEIARAHAGYYSALADEADAHLHDVNEAVWMAKLAAEHDNLRAALSWCLTADPQSGLVLAANLWQFWWVRGHLDEGRGWLDRLLERLPDATPIRARALLGAAFLAMKQGNWEVARAHFEAGLALSRTLGEHVLTAWLLRECATMHGHTSAYAAARTLLVEAVEICRARGHAPGLEDSLLNLARVVRMQGEYAYAMELLDEALASAETRQSAWSIAAIRAVRGDIAIYIGDLTRAAAEYNAGLTAARAVGHRSYEAWTLAGLGQVALWQGDMARAVPLLEEGLALHRALGDANSIGFVLHTLGQAAWQQGDAAHATHLFREALVVRRELRGQANLAATVENLGQVMIACGAPERGVRLIAAAAVARTAVGSTLTPVEDARATEAIRSAKTTLGEAAFAAAWAAGTAASLEQVADEELAMHLARR